MRVKGPGQLWGWVLLGDSASGSATTCCLHHPGHASDPSGPMARGPWVTEAAIKGNVIVSTLRVTNLKLRDAARNLAKTSSALLPRRAETGPPAPGAGVGGWLAGPGSQVQHGAHAGLTCSPPGSWPGSRRPSGWSSPAASGPAAHWGRSPAAPAASGSKRASEGHQNLARTATSGARSASSQLTDKSPKQSAQPKAQVCWFARLLTKVLRQHRAHSHPKDACLLLSDPLGTAPATPGG